jgi:GAF domain-containing protein
MDCSQNITNAQRMDLALKYQDDFNELLDISKQLSSELDTNTLIANIMGSARRLLNCERCSLFMVDKERNQLWAKVSTGINGGKSIRIPMSKGIVGSAATNNNVINIPEAYDDARFNRDIDIQTGYRTKSILCVPIQDSNGEVLGVTQMINKKTGVPFDSNDENLLKAFGAQAAVSLENSQLFEEAVESRNFLSNVLRSIKHHVYAFNEDGHLLQCNHSTETYFGVSEETISVSTFMICIRT